MAEDSAEAEAAFERIRAALTAAADIVAAAMEAEGGHKWDYLIVAVPSAKDLTRIGMMSSVEPEQLPHFIKFIELAFKASAMQGRVIDDRKPKGPAS